MMSAINPGSMCGPKDSMMDWRYVKGSHMKHLMDYRFQLMMWKFGLWLYMKI
jgi:hypothetical protein